MAGMSNTKNTVATSNIDAGISMPLKYTIVSAAIQTAPSVAEIRQSRSPSGCLVRCRTSLVRKPKYLTKRPAHFHWGPQTENDDRRETRRCPE